MEQGDRDVDLLSSVMRKPSVIPGEAKGLHLSAWRWAEMRVVRCAQDDNVPKRLTPVLAGLSLPEVAELQVEPDRVVRHVRGAGGAGDG